MSHHRFEISRIKIAIRNHSLCSNSLRSVWSQSKRANRSVTPVGDRISEFFEASKTISICFAKDNQQFSARCPVPISTDRTAKGSIPEWKIHSQTLMRGKKIYDIQNGCSGNEPSDFVVFRSNRLQNCRNYRDAVAAMVVRSNLQQRIFVAVHFVDPVVCGFIRTWWVVCAHL